MGKIKITDDSCVYIGGVAELLEQLLPDTRVVVVADTNIDRLYHPILAQYDHLLIGLGEQAKTLVTAEKLYNSLVEMEADRSTFILGVGGGVVTDMAGFVASTYMRGVRFGFVPTTLLGQVDAAIGGKNAVNVGGYKNMAGTFSQPQFVICDTDMLSTLSDREFRAGLAEVVKAAIISDAALFERLERTSFEELRSDKVLLREIVEAAIRVKASIVAADECEKGVRRVLNLGHTIAHAVEKCVKGVNHGEAVAVGIACMAEISRRAGKLSAGDCDRMVRLLGRLGFATALPVEMRKLLQAMRKDKKHAGDALHVILPTAIGTVEDMLCHSDEIEELFTINHKMKGLIFDMDGTLVINLDYHLRAFDVQAERHGYKMLQPLTPKYFGHDNVEIMNDVVPPEFLERLGAQFLSDEKEAIYRELYTGNVTPVAGLLDLLDDAKRCGVKCAVGSAGIRPNVELVINECRINDHLTAYVSADDVTRCKPDPEIFLTACKKLGLEPSECVVFEDAVSGIIAGKRAGCKVVALTTTTAVEALEEAGPDLIVEDYRGLTIAELDRLLNN